MVPLQHQPPDDSKGSGQDMVCKYSERPKKGFKRMAPEHTCVRDLYRNQDRYSQSAWSGIKLDESQYCVKPYTHILQYYCFYCYYHTHRKLQSSSQLQPPIIAMNFQLTPVDKCPDISANVRKFLSQKSKRSSTTFMPFEVERVEITPKKRSLLDCRTLYKTAYSEKKHQPSYMKPIKQAKSQRSNSVVQADPYETGIKTISSSSANKKKKSSKFMKFDQDGRSIISSHNQEIMLQTFYTNRLLRHSKTNEFHPRNTENMHEIALEGRMLNHKLLPIHKRLKMIRIMQEQEHFTIDEKSEQDQSVIGGEGRHSYLNRSQTAQNDGNRRHHRGIMGRLAGKEGYADQRRKLVFRTTNSNLKLEQRPNSKIDSRDNLKMTHNPSSNMFEFTYSNFNSFAAHVTNSSFNYKESSR